MESACAKDSTESISSISVMQGEGLIKSRLDRLIKSSLGSLVSLFENLAVNRIKGESKC